MKIPKIDHATLLSLLIYDPGSGVFTWRPRAGRNVFNSRFAAREAGTDTNVANPGGKMRVYRRITIFRKLYYAHQLAFFYMTGEWSSLLDHQDTNGLNNAWINIRPATRSQNASNQNLRLDSASGYKGVSWDAKAQRYKIRARVNHTSAFLGYCDDPYEGSLVYLDYVTRNAGEYARAA